MPDESQHFSELGSGQLGSIEQQRLMLLFDALMFIARSSDQETLLEQIASRMHPLIDFDRCVLALMPTESVPVSAPLDCRLLSGSGAIEDAERTVSERVARSGKLLQTNGDERHIICVPLLASEHSIGSIAFSNTGEPYMDGDVELASAVATFLSFAIDRMRQTHRLRNTRDEMQFQADELRDSRTAALNMLQDADTARQRAEQAERAITQTAAELSESRTAALNILQDVDMARQRAEQAEADIMATARDLESSNKELDDFAYIASHDLKEPLRGISNYAAFLNEDYHDQFDDEGKKKLETIQRLCGRMESLIDTLLNFSRVGRLDMAIEETDLNVIVHDIIDSVHVRLEEENVEVRIPKPLPVITCDRARIGEVFRNLITNAMKYNDKDERWIEIGLWPPDGVAGGDNGGGDSSGRTFYVRDNGIGIREKHIESVFRIFKRLHGRDKYGGGTGAGMTIVKKIVERHGGKVWLESTYGEGTTFFFTLGG